MTTTEEKAEESTLCPVCNDNTFPFEGNLALCHECLQHEVTARYGSIYGAEYLHSYADQANAAGVVAGIDRARALLADKAGQAFVARDDRAELYRALYDQLGTLRAKAEHEKTKAQADHYKVSCAWEIKTDPHHRDD